MDLRDTTPKEISDCKFAFRAALFLLLCIAIRTALAMWVRRASVSHLWYIGLVLLLQSFGFAYIYMYGLRKSGGETFGCPIWWNDMRPVHAIMYGTASWFALRGNGNTTSTVLMVDVLMGLAAFSCFHAKRK